MKAWVQRVLEASVRVDGEIIAEIGQGFLVLLGVTHGDTPAQADEMAALPEMLERPSLSALPDPLEQQRLAARGIFPFQ